MSDTAAQDTNDDTAEAATASHAVIMAFAPNATDNFEPASTVRTGTTGAAVLPVADEVAVATAPVLRHLVLSRVFPELAARWRSGAAGLRFPRPDTGTQDRGTHELARRLLVADHGATVDLVDGMRARAGSCLKLFAILFEPAARCLGDWWSHDICTEFDVALGLAHLQTVLRRLHPGAFAPSRIPAPAVLVIPQPGEPHRLGAALDSEAMRHAGWAPRCEYPADDHALEALLADQWFDALDLSLSAAFRRVEWLPGAARTIAAARRASRNPDLVVVVGGRIFADRGRVGADVGADAACISSLHVTQEIRHALMLLGPGSAAARAR